MARTYNSDLDDDTPERVEDVDETSESEGELPTEDDQGAPDILDEVRRRLDASIQCYQTTHDRAKEDADFIDGHQWPDEIAKQREEDQRPTLTLNHLPHFIDTVVGDARQNRPSIKVFSTAAASRQGEAAPDEEMVNVAGKNRYQRAEVYQGLIRNIEAISHADHAYDTALEHAASLGFGHLRVITAYADDASFDQDILITRVRDPFSVYYDPLATGAVKEDAQWVVVSSWVSEDEFKRRYPNTAMASFDLSSQEWIDTWRKDDAIRLAEYFRRVPETRTLRLLSDGRTIDHDEFDKVADEIEAAGVTVVRERTVQSHKIEWYLLTGADVLEQREWPGRWIPIVPVWGKEAWVDGESVYRGVVRHGKDAQRQHNFWWSAMAETVALQPKAPYLADIRQILPFKDVWDNAHRRNLGVLPYKGIEGVPAPKREAPPMMSEGAFRLALMSVDEMKATMGIYDAALGQRSNETSGIAITARQKETDTVNVTYVDNLSRAIEHVGRILIDLIPRVYDAERIVRIRPGDGDEEDWVAINQTITDEQTGETVTIHDIAAGKYDCVVKVGPSHATARQEAAEQMIAFAQAMGPQVGALIGDLIADSLDWPNADKLAERLRKALPPELQDRDEDAPPTEAEQAQQQMEMQAIQAQMMELQAKVAKAEAEIAKAQAQQAEAENAPVRAQAEMAKAAAATATAEADVAEAQGRLAMDEAAVRAIVAQSIAEFIRQSSAPAPVENMGVEA